MNKQIEVVTPNDEEFETVKSAVSSKNEYKIDYNQLAEDYNQSPIGSILILEAGVGIRTSNITSTIENRGLKYKVDFSAGKLLRDSNGNNILPKDRPIAITKLTAKSIKTFG